MKRVIISVEGQTEQEFVKNLLAPYLRSHDILDVQPILIKKTGGGLVNYDHIRKDVAGYVREGNTVVTTFIDYFRLPKTFPQVENSLQIHRIDDRIDFLEQAFFEDIGFRNFIPYIQKHEFESLLFSSDAGFASYFNNVLSQIHAIMEEYPVPEDINDGPETAPSKRLINIIPGYNKILFGNMIALEVGIETILRECPRFNAWVQKIITEASR